MTASNGKNPAVRSVRITRAQADLFQRAAEAASAAQKELSAITAGILAGHEVETAMNVKFERLDGKPALIFTDLTGVPMPTKPTIVDSA